MTERSDAIVVEIAGRGRLVVGEPYFTPGVPLVLDTKGLGAAGPGDLALVRRGRGRARLLQVLGRADRIESVLEGLLAEEGLRRPFESYDPPPSDLAGRVDLRDLVTFTIDPERAEDFDDALSFREEGAGLRAWVHIADVSHFVRAGSPLDHGAAGRALSVYVPGRVAPMLPPRLADDLCSLRPHQDRLTVTVEVPFDGDLQPGEPVFYRSVIRSDARLAYGQAAAILAGTEPAEPRVEEALRLAERLSGELRTRRFDRGALRIESTEVELSFDGRGGIERGWRESEPLAHSLVEELMILANESVAGLLASRRRGTLYRVHERPDPSAIEHLLAKLADLDVPTPPTPEHLTPALAARLAAEASERIAAYVEQTGRGREAFPGLVLRSLKQARYDPRNLGHSGLASTAYCHFTSPIRRYPDLVVHRTLLRELGADDEATGDLPDLAEHTSTREREADAVERRATDICLAWLLGQRLFELGWDTVFAGEIVGLIGSGLFVRFGEIFEGYVPVRRLGEDWYEATELGTALAGRRFGRRYRLGDPIAVQVEDIRRAEGKIELTLAAGREP